MKKTFVILLVLVMVLPMCLMTSAEDVVELKPFYISNTRDLDVEYDYIYPKIFFWSGSNSNYVTEDELIVSSPDVSGKSPTELADSLKETFDTYPEGMRYLRFGSIRSAMLTLSEDVIFMEKGVAVMKKWFDEFIAYYYSIGGKIDGIVTDLEYIQGESYWLSKTVTEDPLVFNKIVSNPMYAQKIRPQLEERGFKFWPTVTPETPEIYSIYTKSGDEYAQSRDIWDVVYRNHLNQYVNEAMRDAFLKYYPNGILTDYQARDTYAWHKNLTETGKVNTGGNYITAGNANYMNSYGGRPAQSFFASGSKTVYNTIASYNDAIFEDNAYNMVLWDTIFARNLQESAPNGNFTATVTFFSFNSREDSYCNTPYYSEMIYHLGMLDPKPFQSFCIDEDLETAGTDADTAMKVLSELMGELTRIVGKADRKPIATPITWNHKFILSGMYAGGKNYWRITPDTIGTNTTLESFQVVGASDPTFSIEGQTVTFPGGKIIEDEKISQVGTCGYWVETAADVVPVVSYLENRYEAYPAFAEDFQSYAAGAAYSIVNAYPINCWEGKKGKPGDAQIVADGDNNVLALTGSYTLKLKEILKNITAGDTYAKNQTWEVEVKIPSPMESNGEIVLLNVYGSKTEPVEGGFKIVGGKVYYDNNGTYVEMPGVDVSAGGKFKLKRCVDFQNAEAFTSSYFLYDEKGTLLAEAKSIPMVQVNIPVEKIGLSVTNITGKAVELDNFKLYAHGVATDFELYNATTGIQYTDIVSAKDSNTAYRLSWMNATKTEKIYSIVAEYSDGTTKVIKEIKMAPGTDYVDTGIVEVEEGKTVKLYVRNDSQPETSAPADLDDSTSDGKKPEKKSVVLIVTIAGVAVLMALIAVAVVVVLKKPATKAEPETETKE